MSAVGQRGDASSQGPVRVGIIGVGVMGFNHARVLAELPYVEVVGLADPDRSQAMRVADALGCAAVADHKTLIGLGLDAAVIAAPTHLHHAIALDCIAAGLHVLVEKPIAPSVEEGGQIVAAARRAGVTLMVGHVERFNPAVQSIKQAIEGEQILVDRDHARRTVSAANVKCRGRDRSRSA